MRCIGTLEFIDEFQENCRRTQQRLVAAKKANTTKRIKGLSPSLNDPESDKENASPILTPSRKRKREQSNLTIEQSKISSLDVAKKLEPLLSLASGKKNLTISIKESDRAIAELSINKKDRKDSLSSLKNDRKNSFPSLKSDEKNTFPSLKNDEKNSFPSLKNDEKNYFPSLKNDQKNSLSLLKNDQKKSLSLLKNDEKNAFPLPKNDEKKSSSLKNDQKKILSLIKNASTPSTKAKCDSSTKTEFPEEKTNENSSLPSLDSDLSERKIRSRASARNGPKKSLNESKLLLDTPKSKPVAVIVKSEKSENSVKSNELVWIPNEFIALPEAEKPKSSRNETPHDECPIAGDEAGKRVEKSPESSASRVTTISGKSKEISSTEIPRKSVIETTPPKPIELNESKELKELKELNEMKELKKLKELKELNEMKELKELNELNESNELKELKAELKRRRSVLKKDAEIVEEEAAVAEEEEEEDERKKFGKISDLITDEQKLAIEKFYTVDMSVVDEEVVGEKIIFLPKKAFGCKICKASYPRQDKCQVHIWGHLEMRPYRCNACDFATVTVSNIRCHIRKSHLKIKPYACELCEKRYVTAFLLEEHMNTHTGSRPYSCNHCSFTSASRQVLSYHNSTHKPVKDVTCNVCGKEFFSKNRMRAHMVIHNKNKAANMCKLCSIYLCNSEALERHHAKVHSQDHICNVCEKRCKSKKALNNHQNVHSAAKYKCNLCSNVYKSSHILKEHLLKHKGIRKYKCNTCGKDFAQQSHLAAHMAVHSEKRFLCPGCNRPFNRHDNMKMHTKRCEAFLANPELINLLRIRRSRSKPAENSQQSIDLESSNSDEPRSPEIEKQPKKLTSGSQNSKEPKSQRPFELFTIGVSSNELIETEDLTMIIGNTIVIPCT